MQKIVIWNLGKDKDNHSGEDLYQLNLPTGSPVLSSRPARRGWVFKKDTAFQQVIDIPEGGILSVFGSKCSFRGGRPHQ
jgi:hypothetical protein